MSKIVHPLMSTGNSRPLSLSPSLLSLSQFIRKFIKNRPPFSEGASLRVDVISMVKCRLPVAQNMGSLSPAAKEANVNPVFASAEPKRARDTVTE